MHTDITVLTLGKKIVKQSKKLGVYKKLKKQLAYLKQDFFHPSLRTKLLRPRHRGIWQIYLTKQYRAFVVMYKEDNKILAEVIYVGDPHA